MKILHYINNLEAGGAEKLLTILLTLMQEEGHEVHLALSNTNTSVPKYLDTLKESQIKIIDFNCSARSFNNYFKLNDLLREENYDIVHTHIFPSEYWLGLLKNRRNKPKFVKTEHSTKNKRRNYIFLKPIERLIYSNYDLVIGITNEVTELLKNWLSSSKTSFTTIENGVDTSAVKKAFEKSSTDQYKNFMMDNTKSILMVGRFRNDGSKDHKTVFKALKILPENYNLYLAGEGETLEEHKALARSMNLAERIHFLGLRTDVYTIMNIVDINVLSTNYEGLSGVTLESMASQKPYIGSNVNGIKEIVPNQTYLFEPKDSQQLAKKIKEITENSLLANQMVKLANEHVKQYDINSMVNRYLNEYQNLINQH